MIRDEMTTEQVEAYVRFLAARTVKFIKDGVAPDERALATELCSVTHPDCDPSRMVSAFFTLVQAIQHGATCETALRYLLTAQEPVAA